MHDSAELCSLLFRWNLDLWRLYVHDMQSGSYIFLDLVEMQVESPRDHKGQFA